MNFVWSVFGSLISISAQEDSHTNRINDDNEIHDIHIDILPEIHTHTTNNVHITELHQSFLIRSNMRFSLPEVLCVF